MGIKPKAKDTAYIVQVCFLVSFQNIEQFGSHWTDFHEISYLYMIRKVVGEVQVSLKFDKNDMYFNWRPMYICNSILLNSFRMETCFKQIGREYGSIHFCMPPHHWKTLLAKPPHCNSLHRNTRAHYFAYLFQVWPPKSGRYLLLYSWWWAYWCPKHVEAIKTAYFVASSWFFTFTRTFLCFSAAPGPVHEDLHMFFAGEINSP
jgi:hypothetical protein